MFSKWRFPDFPWKQLGYHQNILPYHWLTGMICGKMMVKWWVKHVLHSIWSDLQQLLEKCCILRHTIHGRDRPFPLLPPWSRADAAASEFLDAPTNCHIGADDCPLLQSNAKVLTMPFRSPDGNMVLYLYELKHVYNYIWLSVLYTFTIHTVYVDVPKWHVYP